MYCWEVIDDLGATGIYKVGMTSHRCGDERIRSCANASNLGHEIVFLLRTGEQQAKAIEQQLLASGHEVEMPDHVVDGRTEFRRFGPQAMATINQLQAIAEGKPIETQKLTVRQ